MSYFLSLLLSIVSALATGPSPKVLDGQLENFAKAGRPFGNYGKLNRAPGCPKGSSSEHDNVFLIPDAGVYEFEFGKTGTFAYQSFVTESPFVTFFEVWDCFCGGDDFVVYVDGRKAFEAYGDEDNNCYNWASEPAFCLVNSQYAYGYTFIMPGAHNITVGIRSSPYGSGTGYGALTSVCQIGEYVEQCCWPTALFDFDGSDGVGYCNYRTILNSCDNGSSDCHHRRHHHRGHHHKAAEEIELLKKELKK